MIWWQFLHTKFANVAFKSFALKIFSYKWDQFPTETCLDHINRFRYHLSLRKLRSLALHLIQKSRLYWCLIMLSPRTKVNSSFRIKVHSLVSGCGFTFLLILLFFVKVVFTIIGLFCIVWICSIQISVAGRQLQTISLVWIFLLFRTRYFVDSFPW